MNILRHRITPVLFLTTFLVAFCIQPAFSQQSSIQSTAIRIAAIAVNTCTPPTPPHEMTLALTTERDQIPVSMTGAVHRDGDAIDVNVYHPASLASHTEVRAEISVPLTTDFSGNVPYVVITGPGYSSWDVCDLEGLAFNSYGIPIGVNFNCASEFTPVRVDSSLAGASATEMSAGDYTVYLYDWVTPPLGLNEIHHFTLTVSSTIS